MATDRKIAAKRPKPPASHMDLPKLIEQYGSEDKCHAYLEDLRWPQGVECPRCGSRAISRIHKRLQFHCDGPMEGPLPKGAKKRLSCGYQFSVRVDTIFDRSHLPLWKWFLAVYLIGESKKGISSKQLERTLGVSYKTAWFLSHRIRAAMEDDSPTMLRGTVEVDETWLGGKSSEPWANKIMVLGAVQRGGDVRLKVERRPDRKTLHKFVKDTIHDDASAIHTDALAAYGNLRTTTPAMRSSTTVRKSGSAPTSTRTLWKVCGACSSAPWSAPTISFRPNTCPPIWMRSRSSSTTATTPTSSATRCSD